MRLFFHYARLNMRIWFQYRLDAVLRSSAVFLRESAGIAVLWFALRRFPGVNGWNMHELLFLYSFVFLTYGIFITLFTGLRDFEHLVRTGQFDRFLLRPRGLLFQVMTWDSDWFAAIGQGGLGVALFAWSAGKVGIRWDAPSMAYCAAAVASGVLIQAAIFLVTASASFVAVKTSSLRELLYYNGRKFAGYPISIYPSLIQKAMIYLVPFAFVNYFPAQYFLGKPDMALFWGGFPAIAPAVGLLAFGLSLLVWKAGIRAYSSAGG